MSLSSELLEAVRERVQSNEYLAIVFDQFVLAHLRTYPRTLASSLSPTSSTSSMVKRRSNHGYRLPDAPPYRRVNVGDVILLKRTGGPVVGISKISQVWFYHLDSDSLSELQSAFSDALSAIKESLSFG